jgi:hypothetical protein
MQKITQELFDRAKEMGFDFTEACKCGNPHECICPLVKNVIEYPEYRPTQTEMATALRELMAIHTYPELVAASEDKPKWVATVSFLSEHLLFKDSGRRIRDTYHEAMEDALVLGLEFMADLQEDEEEYGEEDDYDEED